MSRVRIYNQKLFELGLTLPGLVERRKAIASLPSLGLLTLAAHTPDNWKIVYRELAITFRKILWKADDKRIFS